MKMPEKTNSNMKKVPRNIAAAAAAAETTTVAAAEV